MNKLYINHMNQILLLEGTESCNALEADFKLVGHPLAVIAQSKDVNELKIQGIFILHKPTNYSC